MPGGLARFASDAHAEIVSMQRGGGSKDIWVLSDLRRGGRGIDRADRAGSIRARVARHHDLPSTLVENLFWMGRYAERCEDKTRLLRATLGLRRNLPFWPQAMEICKHFGAASAVRSPRSDFTLSGDIGRLGECAAQVRSSLVGRELARAHRPAARLPARRGARGAMRARRSIACCCRWRRSPASRSMT